MPVRFVVLARGSPRVQRRVVRHQAVLDAANADVAGNALTRTWFRRHLLARLQRVRLARIARNSDITWRPAPAA